MRSPADGDVRAEALAVLLNVARESEVLWRQLEMNADVASTVALLRQGPPATQAMACATLRNLVANEAASASVGARFASGGGGECARHVHFILRHLSVA